MPKHYNSLNHCRRFYWALLLFIYAIFYPHEVGIVKPRLVRNNEPSKIDNQSKSIVRIFVLTFDITVFNFSIKSQLHKQID
jgi:hypothetical protein